MTSDWRQVYERDLADPVITDLIRIHRRGWLHFDAAALEDLPSRLAGGRDREISGEELRESLTPFLLGARARRLGPDRFAEWDEESRFALVLFGIHPSTRDSKSVNARRARALRELRESRATQPQSVQKRPWKDQPQGGPEWRLLVRVRQRIRSAFPDGGGPETARPAPDGGELELASRPPDSFVGREAELEAVAAALGSGTLASLVGTGGVGKTRLALEAIRTSSGPANELATFTGRLEDVRGGGDLAEAVARQLGAVREGRESWLDTLATRLGAPPRSLLLLDNCEHLIEESAALAGALLSACPGLKLLVTSREPLSIAGEQVIRLHGLSAEAAPGSVDGFQAPAVKLFVDRAQARVAGLTLDEDDLRVVGELASWVGGLPLALEIAAAWVDRLSVQEIARGLRSELGELANPRRDAADRHRTVEACLDWSYRLLGEQEQRAFRWMSEFVGGWDASASRPLPQHAGEAEASGDAVARLVECSLVERRTVAGASRYHMVELVREYARRRLCDAGEAEPARSAHLSWCLELAAETHDRFGGPAAKNWLTRIDADMPNVRAAIGHAVASGDSEAVLGFSELWWYWFLRGFWTEMRPPLEAALRSGTGSKGSRAQGLLAAGTLAWAAGDLVAACDWLDQARKAAGSDGDLWCESQVAHIEGHVAHYRGQLETAKERFEEALQYWEQHPGSYWLALLQDDVGSVLSDLGERDQARCALIEALRVARAVGDRQATGNALNHLAVVERRCDDPRPALGHGIEAVSALRELGYRRGLANALRNLAETQIVLDDDAGAGEALEEATSIQQAIGHDAGLARSRGTESRLALARQDFIEGARALGRGRSLRAQIGATLSPAEALEEEATLVTLKEALGSERLEELLDSTD